MKQPLLLLLTLVTTLTALPNTAAPADSEARFLTNTRQLTYEGRRSGEGYFSPDGKALVFQSEREADNPFYQIYVLDLESGDINRVSPGSGKTTCSFFRPNSDDVLFASTHLDPNTSKLQKDEFDFRAAGKQRRYSWDYDEHMDIFVARRDGSNLRRLTSARGYDAEGAFSPDGSKIVFSSIRDAYPPEKLSAEDQKKLEVDPAYFAEIYIMNADGSDQRRLTFSPGYDGGPFFSPDGQRIIWRRFDKEGTTADVHTMKLDGSDVRRVTTFAAMSWAPYYHPTGKYVIFTSNKLGFSNFELYLVDAEGTREPVRITYTDGFDGLPVFSPDGKKLCWTANRTTDGKSQLFLADWNHDAALAALASASARTDGKPALTDPHAHVHAPADSTKPAAPALMSPNSPPKSAPPISASKSPISRPTVSKADSPAVSEPSALLTSSPKLCRPPAFVPWVTTAPSFKTSSSAPVSAFLPTTTTSPSPAPPSNPRQPPTPSKKTFALSPSPRPEKSRPM